MILYVPEDNSIPDKGLGVAKQWVHALRLIIDVISSEHYLQRYNKILAREYRLVRSGGRSFLTVDSPPNSNQYLNYFKARGAAKTEIARNREHHQENLFENDFRRLFTVRKYCLFYLFLNSI